MDASRASIRTDFGEEALESGVPLDVFFQRYKPSATEADRSLDGLDLSTSSLNTFEGSSPIAHCSKNPFLAPFTSSTPEKSSPASDFWRSLLDGTDA